MKSRLAPHLAMGMGVVARHGPEPTQAKPELAEPEQAEPELAAHMSGLVC